MTARTFRATEPAQLPEATAERARRNQAEQIRELQNTPLARATIVRGIKLVDGVATPVAHRLGRVPSWVRESCVRGAVTAGAVVEVDQPIGSVNHDRSQTVVLRAIGWGATITLDLLVA